MLIDDPAVRAEVEAAFARYETALTSNDIPTLNALFADDARTVRFGIGENLYGYAAIQGFRAARSPSGLMRTLDRTVITTYGADFAVAITLFRRSNAPGKVGRQMQSWIRMAGGWKIVATHVSVIDEPAV